MTKKVLSILLALVMVLAMAPVSVFAAYTEFKMTATDAVVGEDVTITVGLNNMSTLWSADFKFYYDAEYLEYVDVSANADSDLFYDAGGNPENGLVTFSLMYLNDAGRDRDLVDITFKVLKEGSSDVTATTCSIEGCGTPADASITISTNQNEEPEIPDEPEEPDYVIPDEPVSGEPEEPDYVIPDEPVSDEPEEPDYVIPDEPVSGEPEVPDYENPEEPETPDFEENTGNYFESGGFSFIVTPSADLSTVDVTIGVLSSFESADLTVRFNSEYLEYASCKSHSDVVNNDGFLVAGIPGDYTSEDGILNISCAFMENSGGAINIATVTFNVLQDGSSDFEVNVRSWHGSDTVSDASITISTNQNEEPEEPEIPEEETPDVEENTGNYFESGGFSFIVTPSADLSTVDVTIGVLDDFAWGNLKIYFDSACLEYVDYEKHDELKSKRGAFDAGIPDGYTNEDGIIFAGCMFLQSSGGALNLATFTFNVLAHESSTLTVAANVDDWGNGDAPADGSVIIDIHTHDYAAAITAPDCYENGYTTYTCSSCGDSYLDDFTPASHFCPADSLICGNCGEFVLYYEINEGEASIYYCDKSVNGAIDIPATVTEYVYDFDSVTDMVYGIENVYNITSIVYGAFANCSSLKSVEIPSGVKSIGANSFANCDSLKEITVPESVTTIEENAIGYSFDYDEYAYKLVEGVTIYGYTGSVAETYANNNAISFVALCKHETTLLKNAVEETCTADGYTGDVHCEICDKLLTSGETIAATGHVAEPPMIIIPGCVDEEFTLADICIYCGEKFNERKEMVPGVGHVEQILPEVPATYTSTGLTEGKMCVFCNEILVAQEEIPMLEMPTLKPSTENIIVTDTIVNPTPEMSVEEIIKSVENENVQVLDKDGKELDKNSFVGTGSKINILDKAGKVLSTYEVMVKSDVDGNGKITPADARLSLRAAAGIDAIAGVYETAANYDGKDTVSTSDARMILRKAAGLEQ